MSQSIQNSKDTFVGAILTRKKIPYSAGKWAFFMKKSAFLQKKLILWRILGCWKNLRNDSRMSSWAQISVFGPGKHFRTDLVSSKNIIDLFSSNWKNHAKTHFLRAITSFSMIMSPSEFHTWWDLLFYCVFVEWKLIDSIFYDIP